MFFNTAVAILYFLFLAREGIMINHIEKSLDFIRDNAEAYAQAKAERIYLEEFRKSQKALLVLEATGTIQEKDAYAYSNTKYLLVLDGLKVAVEKEEKLKWMMIAAQAKIEVWRTEQANSRYIDKVHT